MTEADVERVARAIAEHMFHQDREWPADFDEYLLGKYRDCARAAIAAMPRPSADLARPAIDGILEDLDELDLKWPPTKRNGGATRLLDCIKARAIGARDLLAEAVPEVPQESEKDPGEMIPPGWQPIETAPKDGTWVLIAHDDGPWRSPATVRQWRKGVDAKDPFAWYDHLACFRPSLNPQYWQPLAAPPAREREVMMTETMREGLARIIAEYMLTLTRNPDGSMSVDYGAAADAALAYIAAQGHDLVKLWEVAEAACAKAIDRREEIGGAVNWSSLRCVEAARFHTDSGGLGYFVSIEEAAPDASALIEFVLMELARSGFSNVEVHCEW